MDRANKWQGIKSLVAYPGLCDVIQLPINCSYKLIYELPVRLKVIWGTLYLNINTRDSHTTQSCSGLLKQRKLQFPHKSVINVTKDLGRLDASRICHHLEPGI